MKYFQNLNLKLKCKQNGRKSPSSVLRQRKSTKYRNFTRGLLLHPVGQIDGIRTTCGAFGEVTYIRCREAFKDVYHSTQSTTSKIWINTQKMYRLECRGTGDIVWTRNTKVNSFLFTFHKKKYIKSWFYICIYTYFFELYTQHLCPVIRGVFRPMNRRGAKWQTVNLKWQKVTWGSSFPELADNECGLIL